MTANPLDLVFVNKTGLKDSSVFVSFQNGALGTRGFQMTYDGGKPVPIGASDLMSQPLSLESIGAAGLTVDQAVSILIYVSYGKALQSRQSAPAFIGGGLDYDTPFQNFELTMTGSPGDQGDMTAINFFTAPMKIESFDTSGHLLQSVGYNQGADRIAAQLGASATPIWKNLVTDSEGYRIRLIGPSSYGGAAGAPYPSFVPYLKAVAAAGQVTHIVNGNGFVPPHSQTNYMFTLDHQAAAQADGSILLTGQIKTTISGSAGPIFQDCNMTMSAANEVAFNTAIYGQVINSAVTFSGAGWADMAQHLQEWGLSAGAEDTTKNLLVGEISTGLLLGLVNSDTVAPGQSVPLKDMESREWWGLSQLPAFAAAQPDHAFYNPYAAVIYKASANQVYSIPYSDRLGQGPLVNSVSFDGKSVAKWVITLDPPLGTPA
jgi:hypothetical protein